MNHTVNINNTDEPIYCANESFKNEVDNDSTTSKVPIAPTDQAGIPTITNSLTLKNTHLTDENSALKSQLNSLLKDNAELWEQKIELTQQVASLYTSSTQHYNEAEALRRDLLLIDEAKCALEKRSYALNDLLDISAETQTILRAEAETLVQDLSKCRVQKSTLMDQFSVALKELSILGTAVTHVKEKNYELQQQLAVIASPSPLQVVNMLVHNHETNQPYFLVHQFRRLNQKKQLLEAALETLNPAVLKDIVITLRMGLTDKAFAELIEPYPEARDLYISHMMALGSSAWPVLISVLLYLNMQYSAGMLMLRQALVEPSPSGRRLRLAVCQEFFQAHDCLLWERKLLDDFILQLG